MDLKLMIDTLAQNAQPLLSALIGIAIIAAILNSSIAKRFWRTLEDTLFSNWQLGLLATTGIVLSLASGWTTWDGMRNFTAEPLLSGMFTFGIQGVMLIVAWLIGESFATGMNTQSRRSDAPEGIPKSVQTWLGLGIGVLLFVALSTLVLQWTGQADVRQASAEDLSWAKTGDKLLIFASGLLIIALFALYAASDLIKPYIQGTRVIVRNSVLWIMFLATMATSVFFSFDSLFTSIFPQSERVRAAELRAQNQVAGIVTDINQAIADRRMAEADALLKSEGWTGYEAQLTGITKVAAASEGAIERYINSQIEGRRRAVKDQQERMASAQAGQAGIQGRKISLTEEKARLATQRPELAGEYATKKAELDAKAREVDAKRVEALAEDKGVEGTGKEGRGPVYRQRMAELNLMQNAYKIAEERAKDAQKRVTAIELRLAAIDRELATIDGDLAKLKGEAETAGQRIKLAEDTAKDDQGPKLDPTRLMPAFDRALSEFRQDPTAERLGRVQSLCGDISGALSATPETKSQLKGLDCDPKAAMDAAAGLFALQAGTKVFEQSCLGGEKLVANTSADSLFSFARRCLADSALPSKDTDALRTKINFIELSRDDKAHRFVVTWNAFKDGNRLAYLALAIAIAIDSLVFMSGLFGANAVRSPLSDVPTYKSRSASQLEATINAALGAHPYDTAMLTLNALKPLTYTDGFTAMADLSTLDRNTADRVRMVLTAGADIGAVETASHNPERYRVRSELREYLSSVCDRHVKTDPTAKDKARLNQLVGAALEPYPREHADLVLHTLEPIRETDGFTSMVTLSEIKDQNGPKSDYIVTASYNERIVRRVINAGSAVGAVAPDRKVADRYCLRPMLYETLLNIRATAPENPAFAYEHARNLGLPEPHARDGGALRETHDQIAANPNPARGLQKPRATIAAPAGPPPFTAEQAAQWGEHYRERMLSAIGLSSDDVDVRLGSPDLREAMLDAWRVLNNHGKKNDLLGRLLKAFVEQQGESLSRSYSTLKTEADGDERKATILNAVDDRLQSELPYYLLLPDMHLIDNLVTELENAAQYDDGLRPDEEALKDRLLVVQGALGRLDLADPQSWAAIKRDLVSGGDLGLQNILKFGQRKHGGQGGDA